MGCDETEAWCRLQTVLWVTPSLTPPHARHYKISHKLEKSTSEMPTGKKKNFSRKSTLSVERLPKHKLRLVNPYIFFWLLPPRQHIEVSRMLMLLVYFFFPSVWWVSTIAIARLTHSLRFSSTTLRLPVRTSGLQPVLTQVFLFFRAGMSYAPLRQAVGPRTTF